MHTHNVNVKTAAQESSRKMGGKKAMLKTSTLTRAQLRDLLLYIGDNSEKQQQPAFYIPPENAQIITLRTVTPGLQIVLCTVEGWPEAIAIPEAGYLAVLTGVPL